MKKIIFYFFTIFIFLTKLQSQPQKYIDFELMSISSGIIKLSDIVGKKIVLLNFWTTWCPFCVKEIPELKNLASTYSNKGLEIIAVNIREPEKVVRKFVTDKAINYPVVLDLTAEVAQKYRVRGIPTNFLINHKGEIVFVDYLLPSEELIKQLITEMNKPVKPPQKKRKK